MTISGYVGIPFENGGRVREGCDCWGLVRLVLAEVAGIDLPTYGEISADELLKIAHAIEFERASPDWIDVSAMQRRPLDVVVMRRFGEAGRAPVHCGVMLDARRMLHTMQSADSHVVGLGHASVNTRILAIYRHRQLIEDAA